MAGRPVGFGIRWFLLVATPLAFLGGTQWPLAPLAAEAIAAWLLGVGGSAAYISLRGDRGDMPGAAISYVVLGAVWIGGAIFAGDAFRNGADEALYVLFAAGVIAVGSSGAVLSRREGRYRAAAE
jgi:hypothetical protein